MKSRLVNWPIVTVAYVGDPAFNDVPMDAMLSAEHADAIRAQIDPDRALTELGVSAASPQEHRSSP